MMSLKKTAPLIVVVFMASFHSGLADELDDNANLSIEIDDLSSDVPPIFVYVKGNLSGVVPGIVTVPAQENTPVEIGIAGIKTTPLYSFTFGPDVVKNAKLAVQLQISTNPAIGQRGPMSSF